MNEKDVDKAITDIEEIVKRYEDITFTQGYLPLLYSLKETWEKASAIDRQSSLDYTMQGLNMIRIVLLACLELDKRKISMPSLLEEVDGRTH